MTGTKFQSYNGRNRKWILFQNGKIVKTSDEKFAGVTVKKGKGKASGSTSSKKSGTKKKTKTKRKSKKKIDWGFY